MKRTILWIGVFAAAVLGFGVGGYLFAGTVELVTHDTTVSVNNALFTTVTQRPTGTGYIDPFLRIQLKGDESGYNTSVRPLELDQKSDPNYTRPLLFNDVGATRVNGVDYVQFFLDINEQGNTKSTVSLDRLKVFQSATGSVNNFGQSESNLGTKVYDLDSGSNNTVILDGRLEQGSGTGGVTISVPYSLFNPATPYIVLYAEFGRDVNCGGGFEEFTAIRGVAPSTVIPLPAAVWSGLGTFALIAGYVAVRKLARSSPALTT